jgi:hypothetical protein
METGKAKRKEAVLNHVAYWEHQQAEKAKLPYYKDEKIELSYFKTPEQLETCLALVEKYHDKIYIKTSSKNYLTAARQLNLKAVKGIGKAAGVDRPYVYRDPNGEEISVNNRVVDAHGDPIVEIMSLYSFCCLVASRYETEKELKK